MMKVSDYILEALAAAGAQTVFLVPGGAAMHLNDSLAGSTRLAHCSMFHEQAAAVAAEASAKFRNNLGVAMVTAGPGSTNAITGVASAWVNSAPLVIVSGQVKTADLNQGHLRQRGLQEIDIMSVVKPICKYAATIVDPNSARFHTEKAIYEAKAGRPGPVWLAVPLDIQGTKIDPAAQQGFIPDAASNTSKEPYGSSLEEVIRRLNAAERPVLLAGCGIRIAGAERTFLEFVDVLGIPVQTTWIGCDLLGNDHPLYAGRPGSFASRAANFAIQNADFMLAVGARLDLATTGYSRSRFAREAYRVAVDVDSAEISKLGNDIDAGLVLSADKFMGDVIARSGEVQRRDRTAWFERIRMWENRYPIVAPDCGTEAGGVSTYTLLEALGDLLTEEDVIVEGSAGVHSEIFFMAFKLKLGQRVLADGSFGSMGYGLPAAIGTCLAAGRRRTILVEGDGSIQPQLQELETVRRENLPIKLIVVNNGGYSSIRVSQNRFFNRLIGADHTSGLTLPSLEKVANAFGIRFTRIDKTVDVTVALRQVLEEEGPMLCEVVVPLEEDRVPRIANLQRPDGSMVSKPMEDMFPFLERAEFLDNMIVSPVPEE